MSNPCSTKIWGREFSESRCLRHILAFALTVYFVVRLPKGILARLGVSLALFGPILLAYALVATAGIYLDFVIPLFLVIAHLVIEHYSQTPHGAEGG